MLLLPSHHPSCTRGFPVEHYKDNRPGLVVAFWGLALILGRVQISQTDLKSDGTVFGSILNHVTVGRHADGEWADVLRAFESNPKVFSQVIQHV